MPGRLPTSLILLLTVFACGQSATTPCGDGLSCPTFLVCAPLRGECVDEGAMRACAGVPEGGECLDGGELGVCDQGVCVAAACGDGFLTSPEECDDGNLTAGDGCNECLLESCGNGLVEPSEECDCGDFEHPSPACLSRNSDQPGAQCRTDCRNHCGDGVINLAESCEPAMAADQCVAFGFDHGAVACAACRQSFERCGRIGFRHVDGNVGFATTTDIWLSDSGTGFLSMTSIGPIGVAVTFSAHDLSRSYSQLGFRAHAVWGRSAADVYAVGGYFPSAVGGIAHFDGSTWTDLASVPVAPFFLSIWGDDQELLVGGFSGALWRLENDVWTDLSNGDVRNIAVVKTAAGAIVAGGCLPSQGQCLGRFRWRSAAEVWGPAIATPDDRIIRALWTDGEEVLAVGDGGLFCRVEAASCVPEDLNTSVALRDIAGPSRDNLWVVGDADTALHFFGGEWRRVVTGAPNDWVGVAVNSSGAVALASALQGVIGGAFAVADGRSYFFESGPTALGLPRGVYAPDDSGAMIVGDNLSSGAYTLRNGVKTDAGFPAGVLPLAIWGRSWTDIYVVGYAASRLSVQHYDGNTWGDATPPAPPAAPANYTSYPAQAAIWGDATTVTVGGAAGSVFVFEANAWTPMHIPAVDGTVVSLHGTGAERYAVVGAAGDSRLFHHQDGQWQPVLEQRGLIDVWAASAADVHAITDQGLVYHFDGAAWSETAIASGSYWGLTGTAANDVFAWGSGFLTHFDGATWSATRLPAGRLIADFDARPTVSRLVGLGDLALYRSAPW